jgi:phytoene desaturase
MKVAVIGAGLGGLAVAIRLAKAGHKVTVYEANPYAGGKATVYNVKGFRFDAGPSLFTMPQYVEELFALCGEDITQHFAYTRLQHICNYFFEDGTEIIAHSTPEKFAQEIAQKTGDSAANVNRFLKKSAKIYAVTNGLFIQKSLHRLRTYFSKAALKGYIHLHQIDALTTMSKVVNRYFKDSRTRRIFKRYATYNGSNPYQAPGTLNIIPHLEYGIGAYFPKNGIHSITQALLYLCEKTGVDIKLNTKVKSIVHEGGVVRGLVVSPLSTDHSPQQSVDSRLLTVDYNAVISNADVYFTYKHLLTDVKFPEKILNQPRSSSALIFYWGIDKAYPKLDLHNILFSEDYEAEFDCLFTKKTLYTDPTVYINITSKYKPDDAPTGCENWFVMINAPHINGQNWDDLVAQARQNIIAKINRTLHTDIEPHIIAQKTLDPRGIESITQSYLGSLYGTASNNRMAAFYRHPNFSKQLKGLYFVGGSVHPGGGIPLVLSSAKIVADMVGQ